MNIPFLIIFIPPLKGKKDSWHLEFRVRCLARLQGVAQQEVEATVAYTSTLKSGHFMFVQNEEERKDLCGNCAWQSAEIQAFARGITGFMDVNKSLLKR